MKNCTRLVTLLTFAISLSASEIHVAKIGTLEGDGSANAPFLTINQAAEIAMPGDTIIVHEGTYREWVTPLRGGTSEAARIVYKAAPGESVEIKGSEIISNWTQTEELGASVWRKTLPNSFFGDSNPYQTLIFEGGTMPEADTENNGWVTYGNWHTRGDVYLNGEALFEKQTLKETSSIPNTWIAVSDSETTTIYANFSNIDPNISIVEINARESTFMPLESGLDFITVQGFKLQHAASGWAPPTMQFQSGSIGPRGGKNWIIENNIITDSRCVGIILGKAEGIDFNNIDAFGNTIVRNNIVLRCGQAGIAGDTGACRSHIEKNLVEDINYRKEFGGWETAGMKFHGSVDLTIKGNIIRRVEHLQAAAYGIWIDFANQGTRITSNIIYDTAETCIELEHNHGPTLIDNNILKGNSLVSGSEAVILAHNLFILPTFKFGPILPNDERLSAYYTPHTRSAAGTGLGYPGNTRWYNNIFIGHGLDTIEQSDGDQSDYNVLANGALPTTWGDTNSLQLVPPIQTHIQSTRYGAKITFEVDQTYLDFSAPTVDQDLVGILSPTNQTIEDKHGNPISVNTDIQGHLKTENYCGPFSNLKLGLNIIEIDLYSNAPPITLAEPTSLISPLDGESLVNRMTKLRWKKDFSSYVSHYDVFFGTSPELTIEHHLSTVFETQVLLPTLEANTTYYWKVNQVNQAGHTEGTTWSFTTGEKFNLAENSDLESGLPTPWTSFGNEIKITTADARSGIFSLYSGIRNYYYEGFNQSVSGKFEIGKTYRISAWVKQSVPTTEAVEIWIQTTDANGDNYQSLGSTPANSSEWTEISAFYTHNPSLNLQNIVVYWMGGNRETAPTWGIYLDDAEIVEVVSEA